MTYQPDILAEDASGRVSLLVEVKALSRPTSARWAARLRRNLFAHGLATPPRFFLLALPNKLYLWKETPGAPPDERPPEYEMETRQVLAPYLAAANVEEADISGAALELLVTTWLRDVFLRATENDLRPAEEPLRESGLLDELQGPAVVRYPAQ